LCRHLAAEGLVVRQRGNCGFMQQQRLPRP
jgi:hypothetical protein